MKELKCYITDTEIIVPEQEGLDIDSDDETHNCDTMGCSSVRHVFYRMKLNRSYQFPDKQAEEIERLNEEWERMHNASEEYLKIIKEQQANIQRIDNDRIEALKGETE